MSARVWRAGAVVVAVVAWSLCSSGGAGPAAAQGVPVGRKPIRVVYHGN